MSNCAVCQKSIPTVKSTIGRPQEYCSGACKQKAYRERHNRRLRNAVALLNDRNIVKVERPPLRYYGGKWRIASWIIDQFPAHTCYCEPFCGGSSVMLQKPPVRCDVMNDLNNEVINFFEVLRSQPEEFIRAIHLTPYSREELRRARKADPTDNLIEKARRFYVRCWQSYGSGIGKSSTGWRFQIGTGDNSRASAVGSWNDTAHLWTVVERLKQVQIEHDEALKVMDRFDSPETLFYLDPPYVHSTRYHNSSDKGYSHEMTDEDHRTLADRCHQLKGKVIISGYPSGLYDELFAGWKCISRESMDVNGQAQTECLWLSPRTSEVQNMPLFSSGGAPNFK